MTLKNIRNTEQYYVISIVDKSNKIQAKAVAV